MATTAMTVMQPQNGCEIPTWYRGDAGARHVPATRALHCRRCNGALRGRRGCPLGPGSGRSRPLRHRRVLHCRGRCLLFVSLLSLRRSNRQVSCRSFGSRQSAHTTRQAQASKPPGLIIHEHSLITSDPVVQHVKQGAFQLSHQHWPLSQSTGSGICVRTHLSRLLWRCSR